MPLQGTHLLVLDGAREKLAAHGSAAAAARLFVDHPRYAGLGSSAQDLFYFAPDTDPFSREVINQLVSLLEPLAPIFEFHDRYIVPVTDRIEAGLDWVTQGVFGELVETAETICTTLGTLLKGFTFSRLDPWEIVLPSSPLASGHREVAGGDSWFWGDMVHYRRTGPFVQALFANAGGDEELQAFALASATHIGADVTVHPYVNTIVGGPFRLHFGHRHHFVENFLESLAWSRLQGGGNVLDARIVERLNLTGIDPLPLSGLEIVSRATLPGKVVDLLDRTLRQVYPTPPARLRGGYLQADDFQTAYKVFLMVLQLGASKIDPPEPPKIDPDLLSDLLDKLSFDPPPGLPGDFCLTLACAQDLFESVLDFARWGVEQVRKVAELAASAAHVLLSLAAAAAKYVLYLVQSCVYNVYRCYRRVLVWMGFAIPFDLGEAEALDREYFENPELGKGRRLLQAVHDEVYPRRQSPTGFFGRLNLRARIEAMHHVPYPGSGAESPVTPSFFTFDQELVSVLRDRPFSEDDVRALLAAASPEETGTLTEEDQRSLGNSIDFSAFLVREALESQLGEHCWNLDGDRGYAWHTWSWRPDRPALGSPGTAEVDAFYVSCEP